LFYVLFALVGIVVFGFILVRYDVISFETLLGQTKTVTEASSVDELTSGYYYIWHNPDSNNIFDDLSEPGDNIIFTLCPSGDVNWDRDVYVNHMIWFTSANDYSIPTLYPGDKLLYVSDRSIPYKGITWNRFCDYGYTIGVGNLVGDDSDHYHIVSENGKNFKGYVYDKSDAVDLNSYAGVTDLFLDKVGGVPVRKNSISEGGTVSNLDKDQMYLCEWYTGSFYQDFEMTADVHAFCFLEEFTTKDYDFLHSNVIEITIPEWFKTGYYYVNGSGLFRYISSSDSKLYNGEAYDPSVNWNDPIILHDVYNNIIYDPSQGIDKRSEAIAPATVNYHSAYEGLSQSDIDYLQRLGLNPDDDSKLHDNGEGDPGRPASGSQVSSNVLH